MSEQQTYLAYLVRLWRDGDAEPVWRAMLEDAHSGERRGFATLTLLVEFLEEQMGNQPPIGSVPAVERDYPSDFI